MTNENTAFDLEWAKRGGVVYANFEVGYGNATSAGELSGGALYFFERKQNLFVTTKRLGDFDGFTVGSKPCSKRDVRSLCYSTCVELRMATREECAAAGIEYIERPVSAEELAELHEDKEMLEFIFRSNGNVALLGTGEFGFYERAFAIEKRTGMGKTPREAIRAAMKGEMR